MIRKSNNIYEIEGKDLKEILKPRALDSNKGMYGTVGILGGSSSYSGAIKLANMSATSLRAGCGVVRVIVSSKIASYIAPYLLEQTLYILDNINNLELSLTNLDALAVGMGWGISDENKKYLETIIQTFKNPIIIDADGLNNLSMMDLNILNKRRGKIILTPHLKEFSRLTNLSIQKIKENKLTLAKKFAQKYNVILLLKDSKTIITDGTTTYITNSGCPGMATSGSGDVLSGLIVGMLGYLDATTQNIAFASYLAGLAGTLAQRNNTDISMIASDTIASIPQAIKFIREI